jgi:DNA-binding XRE family transcriptional regulator
MKSITSGADRRSSGPQRGRVPDDEPEWIRLACHQEGVRIREAREHASLTQEKLADRAGLGRSTLQRIESGQGIKFVHLVRIARALDVPVRDLVG